MSESALKESQMRMARYLRDPATNPPPQGIEPRRLKIYEELIYNNVEGFIRGGFPVLRSLYEDDDWHALVRMFIDNHRCHSPYFLEISQEFLHFLMQGFTLRDCDPPFMAELAHYEWVELALDIAAEEFQPSPAPADLEGAIPQLSALAWVLAYRFPVHRIGPKFRPEEAEEPTYLVVYRDAEDAVKFVVLNAATARLLELVRDNKGQTVGQLLTQIAAELGIEPASMRGAGLEQVRDFASRGVVFF